MLRRLDSATRARVRLRACRHRRTSRPTAGRGVAPDGPGGRDGLASAPGSVIGSAPSSLFADIVLDLCTTLWHGCAVANTGLPTAILSRDGDRESSLMKVAIIGTGNIGQALGGTLVRAGHEVTLAARHADKAIALAGTIGAAASTSIQAAVRDADVVVLAVPYASLADVA